MKHLLASLVAAALAAGCTLGPDYARPEVPLPEGWREIGAAEAQSLADVPWWELFEDPVLQELIRIALQENKDLKIAVERIEEARALYGFTRAELYPRLDATATAGAARLSEKTVGSAPGADLEDTYFALGASAFWELDVFGRIRRATEAQQAILFATEEARRSVVLSLVAEVARAYMELRDFDRRLAISRRTLESRAEYVVVARDRFEGGKTSEMDWRQAEAEYHRTAAIVSFYELAVALKENELSVLLGRNPGEVARGLELDAMPLPPAIPAGLPSELLERRPDVRQAEELLVSANAGIGAAKALLYPRISLTGAYGWESTDIDDLLQAPAQAWSIGANLLQPIFNAGQNQRRVEVAESQMRQALYEYESSILRALREVEDALVDQRRSGEQRASQGLRVAAERQVLALAELRYRGGVSNYLEVLDAQRSLFNAEIDEAQAIRDQLVALVRLYKSLGGGWPQAPEPSDPARPDAANDSPKE